MNLANENNLTVMIKMDFVRFAKVMLLFILLFVGSVSYGQSFNGGATFAIVGSQLDGDEYGGYNKLNGSLGGFVEINNNNIFFWGAELYYTGKGSHKWSQPKLGDYTAYKAALHYVEMPFLLHARLSEKFTVSTGLGFAVLISAREYSERGEITNGRPFKSFDFPVFLGVKYKVNDKFKTGVRWSYSMMPVREHPSGQAIWYDRGQSNNTLSISLYKYFGL